MGMSVQKFSVVLHGKSSHHEVPYEDTVVTLYLEMADRKLRVKAGALGTAARRLAVTRSRRDGGDADVDRAGASRLVA